MPEVFRNLARSTLASAITSSATSLSIATGDGNSLFPSLAAGEYFRCVLFQKTSGTGQGNVEIIKVTGRTGDILTIERAQEGIGNLAAQAFAFNSGDLIELRPTSEFFNSISDVTTLLIQSNSYNYAVDTGAANQLTIILDPVLTGYSIPGRYMVLVGNTNTGDTTLSVNGLAQKEVLRLDGNQLKAGDVAAGTVADVLYDGANFVLLNPRIPLVENVSIEDDSYLSSRDSAGITELFYRDNYGVDTQLTEGGELKYFPAGTRMLFQQTSAPTGWTKETDSAYDNAALRVQTGAVTNGGTDNFQSVFGSGKNTGNHTLTQNQIPSHRHLNGVADGVTALFVYGDTTTDMPGSATAGVADHSGSATYQGRTDNTGGDGSHNHSLSLDLKYYDVIIATKD